MIHGRIASAWAFLIGAALAALACGGDDPTATSTPIAHPTGAREVVLRYEVGGGLIPPPGPIGFENVLLYGDGRLLVDREGWQEILLTGDGVQRVLRVIEESRFFDQPEQYPNDLCADCPTTTLTVDAGGRRKSVSAYGLGVATPSAGTEAYTRLLGLARFLDSLSASTFRPNEVVSSGAYEPPGVWAKSLPIEVYPPMEGSKPWPEGLPALATLTEGAAVCGYAAETLRSFGPGTRVMGGEGDFIVVYRALFPDDPGAAACDL